MTKSKGRDLYPVIVALMTWGDRWLNEGAKPPLELIHQRCGNKSQPRMVCDCCGEAITAREMTWTSQ